MNTQIEIPYPDRKVFENNLTPITQMTREDQPLLFVDHAEYPPEGGTLVYKFGGRLVHEERDIPGFGWASGKAGLMMYLTRIVQPTIVDRVDLKYPEKGFPYPDAVLANNYAKRYFISNVKFFLKTPLLLLIFLFLPKKAQIVSRWMHEFRQFCKQVLTPHLWQESYYLAFTREMRSFLFKFLTNIGIMEEADGFSKLFAHMIEFDSAYRYRLLDIFSETTKEKLIANPRKEIVRLFEIFKAREPKGHLQAKLGYIVTLASYLLVIPRFKHAFIDALEEIDFTKFQYDDIDRYHVLKYAGYDFLGRDAEDRIKEYEALTGTLPTSHRIGAFDTGNFKK